MEDDQNKGIVGKALAFLTGRSRESALDESESQPVDSSDEVESESDVKGAREKSEASVKMRPRVLSEYAEYLEVEGGEFDFDPRDTLFEDRRKSKFIRNAYDSDMSAEGVAPKSIDDFPYNERDLAALKKLGLSSEDERVVWGIKGESSWDDCTIERVVETLTLDERTFNANQILAIKELRSLRNLSAINCATLATLELSLHDSIGRVEIARCPNLCLVRFLPSKESFFGSRSSVSISNCPSLKKLDCSKDSPTDLEITSCNGLQTIGFSNVPLVKLVLNDCANLETLDCSRNSLEKLVLSGCVKLQTLLCSHNRLCGSLDLSDLVELKRVDFDHNYLERIALPAGSNLVSLRCGRNDLSKIDCSRCVGLREFDCYSNGFRSINLSNCAELETLVCSHNNLSELDLSGCPDLQSLDCSGNRALKTLNFADCHNLQRFDCRECDLRELDVSHCRRLSSLKYDKSKIPEVDLSACPNLFVCSGEESNLPKSAEVAETDFDSPIVLGLDIIDFDDSDMDAEEDEPDLDEFSSSSSSSEFLELDASSSSIIPDEGDE
ncbi:MAG: leucine-rich repeat domain-containing protein [Thermoguttaceae bacterium]|nr:leucine-rich repeat domain-containing protein [Thermoguttaceae bacterium]